MPSFLLLKMWVSVSLGCDITQLVKGRTEVFTTSAKQVHIDSKNHCDSPLASLWPQRAAALSLKNLQHVL